MSSKYESELRLLEMYCDEFMRYKDLYVDAENDEIAQNSIQPELDRKTQIYFKQIQLVQSQFPDEVDWKLHSAQIYHHLAIIKACSPGKLDAAKQEALKLVDQAIGIFDHPTHRLLKAKLNILLGQYPPALSELDFVIANFPDTEFYVDARELKDEIENQTKGGGCFVATAAYGSPFAAEVVLLSRYRDEVLLPSKFGTLFVTFYYRVSPPLATLINSAEILRAMTRSLFLSPLVFLLKVLKFK